MKKITIITKDYNLGKWLKNHMLSNISRQINIDIFNATITYEWEKLDNNLFIFVVNKLSELDSLPYYYEVFYLNLIGSSKVVIIHQEKFGAIGEYKFPISNCKLFNLHHDIKDLLMELNSQLDQVDYFQIEEHQQKIMKLNIDKESLASIIVREIAMAKRLGYNFTIVYLKAKNLNLSNLMAKIFSNAKASLIKCKLREVDMIFFDEDGNIIALFPATNHDGANFAIKKIANELLNFFKMENTHYSNIFYCEIITYPQNVSNSEHMINKLIEIQCEKKGEINMSVFSLKTDKVGYPNEKKNDVFDTLV